MFTDNKAEIKATLTFHGVSKPITLAATLNKTGKSPHGGGMWSDEARRSAYHCAALSNALISVLPIIRNPPAAFSDTITLMLELEAIKQ